MRQRFEVSSPASLQARTSGCHACSHSQAHPEPGFRTRTLDLERHADATGPRSEYVSALKETSGGS